MSDIQSAGQQGITVEPGHWRREESVYVPNGDYISIKSNKSCNEWSEFCCLHWKNHES